MKKTILKSTILVIVFFAALYFISGFMNKGNTDMTAQMGPATFPLIDILAGERPINRLRGYVESMETSYLRESLTPLGEGRSLHFRVDKYGNEITGLSFEVRNLDGSRLIESTEITDYLEEEEIITADINIKDLIEPEQEYTLVLLLNTGAGQTIRFYARIFIPVDCHVEEKMNYVYQFHEKTFNKDEARELTKYLESNATGDNSSFSRVTIHSSFHQVTWGNLEVTKESEPILYIKEMSSQTGSFRLQYKVSLTEGRERSEYAVEEYYRIRYTPDRIYLLDFERTMEQIFAGDPQEIVNSKIILGITDPDIPLVESDGGNVFAFETRNSLYSYIVSDLKFVRLFGFDDSQNQDPRVTYDGHRVKILSVDEVGNVVFMVYGYMNRGRHEGRVGISVYYYNGTVNTVEELVYIPYYKSPDLLVAEIAQMTFLNKNGQLFIMMDNEVYAVDLAERRVETVVREMQEGSYHISPSDKMLVWQQSQEVYEADSLVLMNLQDGQQTEIKAGYGEYLLPLGFMGEDLIYGLARRSDIVRDSLEKIIFPMYSVRIQNEAGTILKDHRQEGYYVTDCTIENNQITLHRLKKTEEGMYEPAADTQITNKVIAADSNNKVEAVITEKYEKVVQIAIMQEVDQAAVMLLTPREVLFEGGREMPIRQEDEAASRYYVYGKRGIEGIYLTERKAVNAAYGISGVVINNKGEYVWERGNLSLRNQIMAIQGRLVGETGNTLAVCLDTMLEYEGVVRNAEYMLGQGESIISILQNNIGGIQVLDLHGCSLDSMLYYVNQDIPVLAALEDGNAVLIVGFNELNIVLMDPQTGGVYKMGMNDSTAWLEDNGNNFISYIRLEE